jgi:hypothetical protein
LELCGIFNSVAEFLRQHSFALRPRGPRPRNAAAPSAYTLCCFQNINLENGAGQGRLCGDWIILSSFFFSHFYAQAACLP